MTSGGKTPESVSTEWQQDRRMDLAISAVLRTGVLASSALVALGGVLFLLQHGHEISFYGTFAGQPEALTSLPGILKLAVSGNGYGLMQAGVVLLLLTPIIRVAFSALAFVFQHDWTYVGIALFVLGVLLYSLAGARFL